jgi:hypothetical protein
MTTKTLNPPPSASVSLDDILNRLPLSERAAVKTRTAELLLGFALKQKLDERAAARASPPKRK